jgi:hypothetical protein
MRLTVAAVMVVVTFICVELSRVPLCCPARVNAARPTQLDQRHSAGALTIASAGKVLSKASSSSLVGSRLYLAMNSALG